MLEAVVFDEVDAVHRSLEEVVARDGALEDDEVEGAAVLDIWMIGGVGGDMDSKSNNGCVEPPCIPSRALIPRAINGERLRESTRQRAHAHLYSP